MLVKAPMLGSVVAITVTEGDSVEVGTVLLVLEVMKVQSNVVAKTAGIVQKILTETGAMVEKGSPLLELLAKTADNKAKPNKPNTLNPQNSTPTNQQSPLQALNERLDKTLDPQRAKAVQKRHARGYRSARENLLDICDPDSFLEYGQLAVAAQRGRSDYAELQSSTAADGIITGVGHVNSDKFKRSVSHTALVINDYSVLAGTQGFFHHMKLDRILAVAEKQRLPVIMYTEGGGGRPGDTDITTVNSGLQCASFSSWAGLAGVVPRISIANGYNFAGNAALFGAADITIATRESWIGMAGPAMIAGGGLGDFKPTEIGPIAVQEKNGVVDIVADNEAHASDLAKQVLGMFQGNLSEWQSAEQSNIGDCLPDNRRFTYDVRKVITTLADTDSFIELKRQFGAAIIIGLVRIQGKPIGLLANDCGVLGGAIDIDAAEKAADFLTLCNQFSIPILSLCDTPGFMVGPEHEQGGAARRLTKLFTAGAKLTVPLVAIVLRKCYGLGAQAMLGGSTARPLYTAAWPSGEFGPMGLEGAVSLGFKKELEAIADLDQRKALFDKLLAESYARGQASEVATMLEIDAVIDPATTRSAIIAALANVQ